MSQATVPIEAARPMPGMGIYNLKLGMWVFLLSEVMFFSSLIGSYIILRFAHPTAWTPDAGRRGGMTPAAYLGPEID